jgi:hypothetical protein
MRNRHDETFWQASWFQSRSQENPIGRLFEGRGTGDLGLKNPSRFLSRKEEESTVEASLVYDYSVWPYEYY